ncbi:hypothetical protein R1flu_000717 [Riccia fluitans]|uniref:Uncharacterized protein n=1 Tax=Riccia fluitans TaxID=41844 RepID=A0ABD1Y474_9MARC
MPRKSERVEIVKQLTRIIDLEIMEEESSSESDGMDDFNSSSESDFHSNPSSSSEASSISDWDSESDVDCDGEDIYDLCSLLDSVEESCYLYRGDRWSKSSEFLYKYFLDLPPGSFRQLTRMDKESFFELLGLIETHEVFMNSAFCQQAPVFVQLAVALDRFGHEENGACLDRSMLL